MKPDIKERWVSALRSGDFVQGRQALNRDGQLCCLGVLCELAVADGVLTSQRASALDWPDNRIEYVSGEARESQLLPPVVRTWAGIDQKGYGDVAVTIDSPDGMLYTSLSELNDEQDFDFGKIANVIEEQL